MAINHGVSLIEKELVQFQPPVPPPPPVGEEHFVIKETPSIDHVRRATLAQRRNTIQVNDDDDDEDADIDSLVDLKLFQFKQGVENPSEESDEPSTIPVPEPTSPVELDPERSEKSPTNSPREFEGKAKLSWIRSTDPRPARKVSFLGGESFKPDVKSRKNL